MKTKPLTIAPELRGKFRAHNDRWRKCFRCPISQYSHNKALIRGTLPCDVLFVGEGPGKYEAVLGYPFVGEAGKLLDVWLAALKNDGFLFNYAVSNVVACRPCENPGAANRAPTALEITNCKPRIREVLELCSPKAIVAVGGAAEEELYDYPRGDIPFVSVRHPAYVLRQGGAGSPADDRERVRLFEYFDRFEKKGIVKWQRPD